MLLIFSGCVLVGVLLLASSAALNYWRDNLVMHDIRIEGGDVAALWRPGRSFLRNVPGVCRLVGQYEVSDVKLSGTGIRKGQLRDIARFGSLRRLDICVTGTTQQGKIDLSDLQYLPCLAFLHLAKAVVDDATMDSIAQSCPSLEGLMFSHCVITQDVLPLQKLVFLESLTIADSQVGPGALIERENHPALKHVDIQGTRVIQKTPIRTGIE
jgi:hypothetical protein